MFHAQTVGVKKLGRYLPY